MSYDNYEEEKPTDRLDLGGRYTKKQKQDNQVFTDWRTSSRIADTDEIFKAVVKAEKLKRGSQQKQQVKQGSSIDIDGRIRRMNIIQQAVKAGTYNDPLQPWNQKSRWIEDGNGDLKQ